MIKPNLFNIMQDCSCTITIDDNYNQMCDFSGIYKFDYKDTMTIDIITIDKVSDSELAAIVFTSHDLDVAEVQLPLGGDGAYNITHLILPTIEWYKNELTKEHSKLYKYQDIYVTDGKNIYRLENGELVLIDPLELTLLNAYNQTTVIKDQKSIFLTCYLQNCYIYLCNEIMNKLAGNINNISGHNLGTCNNIDADIKDLIYRRDLVYITLNVIEYLIQDNRFDEAQEILENIQSCNGICYNKDNDIKPSEAYFANGSSQGTLYNVGCGCGK